MNFEQVPLNKVTHAVRAAQAVLQYGVGAMVDFPDQTLVTAAPEKWQHYEKKFDDRFARALGVEYFALPTGISYERFPEWYFCPKCRKFQPLKKWIDDYRKKASSKIQSWDPSMTRHMQCPACHQDLVVARIVTVCEQGHLNDFPWVKWVHVKSRPRRSVCGKPELKFTTGASGTEGLEGLTISCSCGAKATLKGAFEKECFEKLDEELQQDLFLCEGNHPFKHEKCNCNFHPRTVQRGASSVYFPLVYSSLVIPPYADKLYQKVENSPSFEKLANFIEVMGDDNDDAADMIKKKISTFAGKIAVEIGEDKSRIERILEQKFLETDAPVHEVTSVQYRLEEYQALTGQTAPTGNAIGDFSREEIDISEYDLPHIKSIALIDKVRVVNALVGFSRLTPVTNCNDVGYVDIKQPETKWYPAYEVRGEGIFIEFKTDDIQRWINENPEVKERAALINHHYETSILGSNRERVITPKMIMLHTLSHLLITQMSFECGYSVASLSERLYCAEKEDGGEMAGIFIYTASGDCEGTLGGLVRQGRPDTFPKIFKKALANAQICSNDPVCILSRGQGRDSLNLAACHACTLLPETCCEERNGFLDRGLVIGTYDNKSIGFWNENS